MSKSLKRVRAAIIAAGLESEIVEMADTTRTAQQAADGVKCDVNQIAKSIIFQGLDCQNAVLFLTAGGNQVNAGKATTLAGEPLGKADAAFIRHQTRFAIGGVAPIGYLNPIRTFMDPKLFEFALIWAAAGTPRHFFEISPPDLENTCSAHISDFIT